jgi:hypothetical protein
MMRQGLTLVRIVGPISGGCISPNDNRKDRVALLSVEYARAE